MLRIWIPHHRKSFSPVPFSFQVHLAAYPFYTNWLLQKVLKRTISIIAFIRFAECSAFLLKFLLLNSHPSVLFPPSRPTPLPTKHKHLKYWILYFLSYFYVKHENELCAVNKKGGGRWLRNGRECEWIKLNEN